MKREYYSPEFDLVKFSFERTLSDGDDDFPGVKHSGAQGIGESGGALD